MNYEAIEKVNLEESKKPLNTYALSHGEGTNGKCPNCNKTVNCYSDYDECTSCKQKLKWR